MVSQHHLPTLRHLFSGTLVVLLLITSAPAQLRISGQASAAFLAGESGPSQYVVNDGRRTFAWRLDLFGDAEIADHLFFMSNLRIMQDQTFRVDRLSLKMNDVASTGITAEAGLIELPVGNLGERRFPWANPFTSLPLAREHRTSFKTSTYTVEFGYPPYDGFRIMDLGLYDAGVKLSYTVGICDLTVALINGMVSSTTSYADGSYGSGMNATGGFGRIARVAVTPATGVTFGCSYAYGPFLHPRNSAYSTTVDPIANPQELIEADCDFSLGHFALYAEGFLNDWKLQNMYSPELKAGGYSVEAKLTPIPRLSFAARVGGIVFNAPFVSLQYGNSSAYTWDHNVLRYEAAVGYRVDRSALIKIAYQWNVTDDLNPDPPDNLFAVQTVLTF